LTQKDQRRYPRYRCEGIAQMTRPGDKFAIRAPLTDVSAGGFYVETMTPLPEGTELEISLEIGRVELYAQGVVETSHQAIGNGIAFTKMTPQNEKALQAVIDKLTNADVIHSAVGLHSFPPEFEALLALLERKSVLKREEVITELKAIAARR
jgi:PilZ domain-containing protein